ncbi:MAG: hypothetical protein ACR2NU_14985 [Aeoliella sp.]
MNTENPYAYTPAQPDAVSRRDLEKLANRFVAYREIPPTVASMVLAWRALLVFLVYGIVTIPLLVWLVGDSESTILQHAPTVVVSMLIGAVLRDFNMIRQFVRAWPAWNEIIDWKKIEEFAS